LAKNSRISSTPAAHLGDHADSSWVGTGANKTVTSDQITGALGGANVAAMAQKLGINLQVAAAGLAALLPAVLDHLTPNGQVETGSDLSATLAAIKTKMLASATSPREDACACGSRCRPSRSAPRP
jgi:hypothetical protein